MKDARIYGYNLDNAAHGALAESRFNMHSYTAKQISINNGIPLHVDFHMLPSEIVDRILIAAKEYGYRKPKNANGSTLLRLCRG